MRIRDFRTHLFNTYCNLHFPRCIITFSKHPSDETLRHPDAPLPISISPPDRSFVDHGEPGLHHWDRSLELASCAPSIVVGGACLRSCGVRSRSSPDCKFDCVSLSAPLRSPQQLPLHLPILVTLRCRQPRKSVFRHRSSLQPTVVDEPIVLNRALYVPQLTFGLDPDLRTATSR